MSVLLCLAAAPRQTRAQAAAPPTRAQEAIPDIVAKMNSKVHLLLGAVTLPQVAQALSAQSGLDIQAADTLRERRLVVQMDGLALKTALNALAELNDWSWSDRGGGHIVITRLSLMIRQEASTVPLRMRLALPRDVRVACNLEPQPPQAKRQNASQDGANDFMAGLNAEHRGGELAQQARLHLIDTLSPTIFKGTPVYFAGLKTSQQQDMLISLLLAAVEATNHAMLRGQTLPWLDNPAGMRMSLNGNTLIVFTHEDTGFGVQVQP